MNVFLLMVDHLWGLILRYLLQSQPLPEHLVGCRFPCFLFFLLFASASAATPDRRRDVHCDPRCRCPKAQSGQGAVDLRWRLGVGRGRLHCSIVILLESSARVCKGANAFCRGNVLGYGRESRALAWRCDGAVQRLFVQRFG